MTDRIEELTRDVAAATLNLLLDTDEIDDDTRAEFENAIFAELAASYEKFESVFYTAPTVWECIVAAYTNGDMDI